MTVYTFRRPRRRPEPTTRLTAALVIAIVLLLLGCGLGLRRAYADEAEQECSMEHSCSALEDAALAVWATPTPTEVPRYTPASRGPRAAAEDVVARHFPPEAVPQAMAVLVCESRLDPWATGRLGEAGYMQIHPVWQGLAERLYGPGADLYDPDTNLGVAAAIWRSSGWAPWSCRP